MIRIRSKYIRICFCMLGIIGASAVNAQYIEQSTPIGTDFKQLVLKAMKSPDGSATAMVDGPVADMVRGQIQKPDARVAVTVTTVRPLPIKGCKRMKLEFSTPGTKIKSFDGTMRPLELAFQMNMCENGTPISDKEIAAFDGSAQLESN